MNCRICKVVLVVTSSVFAIGFLISYLSKGALTSPYTADLFSVNQIKEIEGYKNWTKVNSVPQLMPERVATDCAVWKAPGGTHVNGESNPHRDKYFTVYVNEVGRKAMLNQKNPKFPEGSIIVKEKLSAVDSQTPELLTVMIKQKIGFNVASGDWEYMVLNGLGTNVEERGNLQNCQSCHIAYQKADYIFRTYLSEDVRSQLK